MNLFPLAPPSTWLLADQTQQRINNVAQRFQGGASHISTGDIALIIAIVFAVGIVLWRVARSSAARNGQSYYSPRKLFNELSQLHQLDWKQRRLLRRLAHARRLEHPALLFLEPTSLDVTNTPPSLAASRAQLDEIRQRLFESDR